MTDYDVQLNRKYQCDRVSICRLILTNTLFKLTGADRIEGTWKSGHSFHLDFLNRGIIYGQFIEVTESLSVLEWNVSGFNLPDERNTRVEISLIERVGFTEIRISHHRIPSRESALKKQKAWQEILNDFEKQLINKA